jgi:cell division septum initiation protein DivIVA
VNNLTNLSGNITVFGNSISNIENVLTSSVLPQVSQALARILMAPTEMTLGTTQSILFKTQTGLNPTLSVYNSVGVLQVSVPMIEIGSTGLYEADITATWGLGMYSLRADDGTNADGMTFRVMANDIDSLAAMLTAVSNQVANIETNLATVSTNVLAIRAQTDTIVWNDIAALTNLLSTLDFTPIADLTNSLANLDFSSVTNITSIETTLVDIQSSVESINWTDIDEIRNTLTTLQEANLGDLNFSALNDISAITATLSDIGSLLGSSSDNPGTDTFFGRLNELSDALVGAGGSASLAARNSQSAKTASQDILSQINLLENAVKSGNTQLANQLKAQIGKNVESLRDAIDRVGKENFAKMARQVESTHSQVQSILQLLAEEDDDKGKTKEGAEMDPKELMARMAEMKADIELMQKVLDKVANPTVVTVDWFEP